MNSELWFRFRRSRLAMSCAAVALVCLTSALLAPWIAPHDPFDLSSISILEAMRPPAWMHGGELRFILGTDDQGRDLLSAILYGARVSVLVAGLAVALSIAVGVAIGLLAGYAGGAVDALLMRLADVQLSFPAILIALLVDGTVRILVPRANDGSSVLILVLAIAASGWVQYARTVRGATLVERDKEYVQAARVMGVPALQLLGGHLLPNVIGPTLVLGTVHLSAAVVTEATLSFLGVGLPPATPSLGTLIRTGNDYLFSGRWWVTVFPGLTLVALAMSVNLLGDWLRDALNPRLG
jgi:peptide/nickel transport system permease protein